MFRLAIFCCCCLTLGHGLSFLNKLRLFNFPEEELKKLAFNNREDAKGNSCTDQLSEESCTAYMKYCRSHKFVRVKCTQTCNLCRKAHSQPLCTESEFGCCWDNFSTAIGPERICPPCADKGVECLLLTRKCDDEAVRRICPRTCGIKCEQCEDDVHQAKSCPLFKKIDACKTDPGLMKKYCKKTCGFC